MTSEVSSDSTWIERTVDSFYSVVWPSKAVKRRHFRRLERDSEYREAVGVALNVRGYRAARHLAEQTPWRSLDQIGRSADTEILWDLPILRNRSRELNRDDSIGSGLTSEFVRKIVGPGLSPQSRTGDLDKNATIESAFDLLSANLSPADGLNYAALQQMRCYKLLEDGDLFVKASVVDDRLITETVEADRVMTPPGVDAKVQKLHRVVDGVEKDVNGFPVAYWVRKYHPGQHHIKTAPLADTTMLGVSFNVSDFERVPVGQIMHVKLATRPGQTRGVPFTHAVMQDIRDLDLLILASLKRTQLAACLAVFIESSESAEDLLDLTAMQYGYQMDQDINPGMIFKLFPGEKVNFLNPNFPAFDLAEFVKTLARRIGAALGVSWQTVLNDWSTSNYSSARQQILENRPTFASYRDKLKPLFVWERGMVLAHAMLRGDLPGITREDIDAVDLLDPAQPWIDPEKDAKSIELKLQLGLTTLRDEAAKLNQDWEELTAQRIREKLLAERLEIDLREEFGLDPMVKADNADQVPSAGAEGSDSAGDGDKPVTEAA